MPMMPRRPVLLLCLLTTWWMLCPMPGRSAPNATPELPRESSGSTICFSAEEYANLEAEIQAELRRTATEAADAAVKAAVAPLLADIAGLRKAADLLREALAAETARADAAEGRARTAEALAWAGGGAAAAGLAALLVSLLLD